MKRRNPVQRELRENPPKPKRIEHERFEPSVEEGLDEYYEQLEGEEEIEE